MVSSGWCLTASAAGSTPPRLFFSTAPIEFYSQEIRTKPNTAAAYHQRGLIWEFQGQRTSDRRLTEAIRLDSKDPSTYADRGGIFLRNNENEKAVADFTEAIRLDPTDAWFYGKRGLGWSNQSEHDKAVADYPEAIELDPEFAWAYTNRGQAWTEKNQFDKAINDYTDAIRIDPRFQFTFTLRDHVRGLKYDLAIVQLSLAFSSIPRTRCLHWPRHRVVLEA